jgi:hypothetical protein
MKTSLLSAFILATGVAAWAPAIAQTSPGPDAPSATASQKQPAQADGPPVVGPASGAYKESSDPKAWDAEARAWHKEHTDARESIGYSDQQRREADRNTARSAGPLNDQQ